MRSHKICAIAQCPIASPKLNQVIETLNRMLHDPKWPRMVRSLEVFTDETGVQLNLLETDRPVARRFFEWCGENIAGLVEGASGLQRAVSREPRIVLSGESISDRSSGGSGGGGDRGESAFDLYAGVGLFAPALASRFTQVTAVESGSAAARDLQFNAERAGSRERASGSPHGGRVLAGAGGPSGLSVVGPAARGSGQGGSAPVGGI
jgi:23S rRNA (uracil1939-C5)-methyltransferase